VNIILTRPAGGFLRGRLSSNVRPHGFQASPVPQCPLLPALLLLLAVAAGFASYLHFQRYGDARALEVGLTPEAARTGSMDDGGATEFDRRIWKEIVSGEHRAKSDEIHRMSRLAYGWTLASVALAVLAVAAWVGLA
jgi:hypothetical protein